MWTLTTSMTIFFQAKQTVFWPCNRFWLVKIVNTLPLSIYGGRWEIRPNCLVLPPSTPSHPANCKSFLLQHKIPLRQRDSWTSWDQRHRAKRKEVYAMRKRITTSHPQLWSDSSWAVSIPTWPGVQRLRWCLPVALWGRGEDLCFDCLSCFTNISDQWAACNNPGGVRHI